MKLYYLHLLHVTTQVANNKNSPRALGRPVPLPSVLEPVGHLGGGQPRALRQLPLLAGGRVRVVRVPVAENLNKKQKIICNKNISYTGKIYYMKQKYFICSKNILTMPTVNMFVESKLATLPACL